MSLRTKLTIFSLAFAVLTAGLVAGSFFIFNRMTGNFAAQRSAAEGYNIYNEWHSAVADFVMTAEGWAVTGDIRHKKKYRGKLRDVYTSFSRLHMITQDRPEIEAIGKDFEELKKFADNIMVSEQPVGDTAVLFALRRLEEKDWEIRARMDTLRSRAINSFTIAIGLGEKIERQMEFYLGVLFLFSSFGFLSLSLFMRRMIAVPFGDLLKATEKISRGELTYRIGSKRRDEFGTISKRFDEMVEKLQDSNTKIQNKLAETELLLETARIAATTPELKEALDMIAGTIANKLGKDTCSIYLYRQERNAFCLEANSTTEELSGDKCLPLDHGIVEEIIKSLSPVVIYDMQNPLSPPFAKGGMGGLDVSGKFGSLLAVPIVRDNQCFGLLILKTYRAYGFIPDEINTINILSHTISSGVRNTELYTATKNQLQKLTVLYELGTTVTSVMDLDELLKIVASEITKLLNAKGCIIRLLEDGILRIKSSYGLADELREQMDLVVGDGIAGWVAKEGTPLLVEDVSKMPADMRVPVIDVKSVICVPLKVGREIIGTLGLYDRIGPEGVVISFSIDDMNTVTTFASISAIAIEKAKIYESKFLSENRAVEAKKRLDILFDSVQGGIVTLGKEHEIISVNKFIEDWTNMAAGEIIGKNAVEVFHEKGGICPHCVAKVTYETGQINSITQSRGMNYAELTSYPIRDEAGNIIECVVFIQDITDRVLYHEEILGLYKEVAQTKDYLESLIDNSADAIVTSDLNGIITSWNQGADRIFGYTEIEAVGKFLPFVPQFLLDTEKEHIERIKKGETLKDVEILRQRRDGTIIEISLTLSPIKDTAGEVIGISGISRDISERKRVEKELIRRNQELSRLFFISSAMRGTLDLDRLLRMVLTGVTMSDGLGFNRAILFLIDEKRGVIKGAMGVGPASPEEAWQIWEKLSIEKRTLPEIMRDIEAGPLRKDSFLDRLSIGMEIPIEDNTILTRTVKEKKAIAVPDVKKEPLSDAVLIQQLGTQAYAAVPLISRDKVIGVLWVDNFFTKRLITEEDMKFLTGFSNQVASAIENARLFEQVSRAEAELENIFGSISDMVYITDKNYTIKNINKAVADRIGRPAGEIIDKKCYEIFHGMNEPLIECPHHKTVTTRKAYIEEVEDKYLGGTFLTSSSPVFDPGGEFVGTVHVVRDITELDNLRDKLAAAERMAALGEVAAKVAHEIRNPLVSVGGFARRLEGKLDGNLKEYAGIISKEVGRLEDILKEILGFVKEARLVKERIDINEIINDIILLTETEVKERGIRLVREATGTLQVLVDPNRIKDALLNIFNNAIQALTTNGTITVKTYSAEDSAVVEIGDTGPGIDEKDLPFIFSPFYTTKAAGTGLGLAITNRIIEEHKGRIEVESISGKGTTFKVFLPIMSKQDDLN
ncbi:MAG: PAS domain S-box protein [Nitrospirae bacterium]|nr:PAS domain S-box protein [Nitrospirota bacterium]